MSQSESKQATETLWVFQTKDIQSRELALQVMEEMRRDSNGEAAERLARPESKRERLSLWKLRIQCRVEAGTSGAPLKAEKNTHGQAPAFHYPVLNTVLTDWTHLEARKPGECSSLWYRGKQRKDFVLVWVPTGIRYAQENRIIWGGFIP